MARMLDFAPFFNLLRSAVAIYLKYLNVLKALCTSIYAIKSNCKNVVSLISPHGLLSICHRLVASQLFSLCTPAYSTNPDQYMQNKYLC